MTASVPKTIAKPSSTAVGMTAPLILLFLPFLDVALSIVRRFLNMKPIFGADRGHIHHRLLALGLRPRHVALLAYAACGLAAVVSMIQSNAPREYGMFVVAAFGLLVWLAVAKLGYAEFRATYRTLWNGQLRRTFRQEIVMEQLRTTLASASSEEECWDQLCSASRELGLAQVWLKSGGQDRQAQLQEIDAGLSYETRVPLRDGSYVVFTGRHSDPATAQLLLPLAAALREALVRQPAPLPVPTASPDRSLGTTPR